MTNTQILFKKLFRRRPSLILRVFGSVIDKALLDVATEQVGADLQCQIKWFIANGIASEYDLTLLLQPVPAFASNKPWRAVVVHRVSARADIDAIVDALRTCIAELAAQQ